MKALQVSPFPLTSPVYQTGRNSVMPLRELPLTIENRIAHLAGFLIEVRATPTLTTAPTLAGFWSIINNIIMRDGQTERVNISAMTLRDMLIMEQGHNPLPDPDLTSGTGNLFVARAFLPMGPLNSEGWQTDWVYPAASLRNAELVFQYGALTDFSADTTAMSCQVLVTALMVALDNEVRVPPAFERRSYTLAANDNNIPGAALYNSLHLGDSAYAVLTAGQVGNVNVVTGVGGFGPVPSTHLNAIAHLGLNASIITQLRGEPLAATDDNEKVVNLTSPTAIAAADNRIQVIIPAHMGSRISKLLYMSENLKAKWSGTKTTSVMLTVGRILEQPPDAAALIATKAATTLQRGVFKDAKTKTLDGSEYKGPRAAFMPFAYKWG